MGERVPTDEVPVENQGDAQEMPNYNTCCCAIVSIFLFHFHFPFPPPFFPGGRSKLVPCWFTVGLPRTRRYVHGTVQYNTVSYPQSIPREEKRRWTVPPAWERGGSPPQKPHSNPGPDQGQGQQHDDHIGASAAQEHDGVARGNGQPAQHHAAHGAPLARAPERQQRESDRDVAYADQRERFGEGKGGLPG